MPDKKLMLGASLQFNLASFYILRETEAGNNKHETLILNLQ